MFENLILLGSATGEGYLSPPGDLRAFDVLTGKLVWQFHTVPHPGEFGYETWPKDAYKYIGGVNTWGEFTVDANAASPTSRSAHRPTTTTAPTGRAPTCSAARLVALDARTGKRLWHFQMVHHDLWDFDGNAAPQLTTISTTASASTLSRSPARPDSSTSSTVSRATPIWPIEERAVPKSDMPGEQSWPTQPFPTNPPPFSKQSFTVDDINPHPIITDDDARGFKRHLAATRNQGLFTPIHFDDTLHIPGSNGGALFGYTAAEPTNGSVYVISQDNPGHSAPREDHAAGGPPGWPPTSATVPPAMDRLPRHARTGHHCWT